jgi:lipoprotein NlpI
MSSSPAGASPANRRLLTSHIAAGCLAAAFLSTASAADPEPKATPRALFDRAVTLFFAGRPTESAAVFDDLLATDPASAPALWQRGLALYYADRFEDGRRQFELHRTVNPDDVENPAWHFLCVARATTPAAARRQMLPVGKDERVPMREILAVFEGRGSPEDVLMAANRGAEGDRHNQLCYAHLYLGLYAEALGDTADARRHISLAAGPYRMNHYMGRVAQVHVRLRGWSDADAVSDPIRPAP